jgi:hypothetical protein
MAAGASACARRRRRPRARHGAAGVMHGAVRMRMRFSRSAGPRQPRPTARPGAGHAAATWPYAWAHTGRVPRAPQTVVARLLTDSLRLLRVAFFCIPWELHKLELGLGNRTPQVQLWLNPYRVGGAGEAGIRAGGAPLGNRTLPCGYRTCP